MDEFQRQNARDTQSDNLFNRLRYALNYYRHGMIPTDDATLRGIVNALSESIYGLPALVELVERAEKNGPYN